LKDSAVIEGLKKNTTTFVIACCLTACVKGCLQILSRVLNVALVLLMLLLA
jgi:hypothetical protein